MMYTSLLAAVAIFGFLAWIAVKTVLLIVAHFRFVSYFKNIPQPPAHPILGTVLEFPGPGEAGMQYQRNRVKHYPRIDVAWNLMTPVLMLNHPDTLKIILRSSEPKGRAIYNLLTPWIGDGLLKSSGQKWARNRRLLTPAFHFEILKNYLPLKNEAADTLVDKFAKAAATKTSLEVVTNVSLYTLDVILRSSMSYETDCQQLGERHPYVLAVNQITDLIRDRFLKPWFHNDIIYSLTPNGRKFYRHCNYVHSIANDVIENRRQKLENEKNDVGDLDKDDKKRKYKDFLDILLTAKDEDGRGLTSQEIRDEVDTFLFEGHETTASAISWTLYSVAKYPDIQEKIHQELDKRFANRDSSEIFWEDLNEFPYLTMVVKEAMRHHSTVPFINRELTKDLAVDKYVIPAGTMVNIVIYNVHHNPIVWDDPLKFDPDRFLPENVEKRDPFAFVPFSAGPRNCIGQNFAMDEMKIALAKILHRFSIILDPHHEVHQSESLIMKADDDIRLLITERSKAQI